MRADNRRGVTTATLAVFAGGLSLFGAVYTARSFRANRDAADRKHALDLEAHAHSQTAADDRHELDLAAHAQSQQAADHRHELDLAAHALDQARQISERFTRAIEQLGSPELDVRRGGIYALERISRDSPADHPHVVEALTAFVRDHAPWPPEQPERVTTRPRRPSSDIQAAMTVLGRRDISRDSGDVQIRLSAVDLRRVSLRGGHFEGARLRRAHLEGAHSKGRTFRAQSSGTHSFRMRTWALTPSSNCQPQTSREPRCMEQTSQARN